MVMCTVYMHRSSMCIHVLFLICSAEKQSSAATAAAAASAMLRLLALGVMCGRKTE